MDLHLISCFTNTRVIGRADGNVICFDTGVIETHIIPVMCGDSKKAQDLASSMREEGVMVGAIVFPMVSRDKARVRTQMSAGLSREELDTVLESFDRCGRKAGLI